jgi:hypothetical protein
MSNYKQRSVRRAVISLLSVLTIPAWSTSVRAENLTEVESQVYETPGTIPEITKRAKRCMLENVRNDDVKIGSTVNSDKERGGSAIADVDLEGGAIVSNNRVDYSRMMLAHTVKSTMTFMAKEGRFKIRHTNIESLQKNTGYMANTGFRPVVKQWGTGWEAANEALVGVTEKVAQCVMKPADEKAW